jgi:hypothetical protein
MRRAPRWSDGKPHNTSDASRKGRHRNIIDCLSVKMLDFKKLALNLGAYEIIKDVFLFPFPKILDLI